MKVFAGIGSRETPESILEVMHEISHVLTSEGWYCRTGMADGADMAFATGAVPGKLIAYLPWATYQYEICKKIKGLRLADEVTQAAIEMAHNFHPNLSKQSWEKLHGRNMQIILGKDLDKPCDVVICWTPKGELVGGTATGIKCAKKNGIKVINLGSKDIDPSVKTILAML